MLALGASVWCAPNAGCRGSRRRAECYPFSSGSHIMNAKRPTIAHSAHSGVSAIMATASRCQSARLDAQIWSRAAPARRARS
jgi:hypothetical protein